MLTAKAFAGPIALVVSRPANVNRDFEANEALFDTEVPSVR